MLGNTMAKLWESIRGNDSYIGFFAILTAVFFFITLWAAISIRKQIKCWKEKRNTPFSRFLFHTCNTVYTLFVALISIFPLLGMLGTVFGLLGLDLATGDMDNIKNNFFIALTSTAWGIIFSVGFKILHAVFSDFIEEQIEVSKKLMGDVDANEE